jgi:hypothetical protein
VDEDAAPGEALLNQLVEVTEEGGDVLLLTVEQRVDYMPDCGAEDQLRHVAGGCNH